MIDDGVSTTMETDLVDDPLVGVFGNLGREALEEHDEVIFSFMSCSFYTRNPCKLDLDLNNHESPPPFLLLFIHFNSNLSHCHHIFDMSSWLRIVLFQSLLRVIYCLDK